MSFSRLVNCVVCEKEVRIFNADKMDWEIEESYFHIKKYEKRICLKCLEDLKNA